MKNLFYATLFAAISFILLPSCTKEVTQNEIIKELTIDTTIAVNSALNIDLSRVFNPSKTVNIIQQAKYYKISSIETVEDTNDPYYTYTSSLQSSGTDNIVLSVSDKNPVKGATADSTIIYINVTIK